MKYHLEINPDFSTLFKTKKKSYQMKYCFSISADHQDGEWTELCWVEKYIMHDQKKNRSIFKN